jgi:hypothetical protein
MRQLPREPCGRATNRSLHRSARPGCTRTSYGTGCARVSEPGDHEAPASRTPKSPRHGAERRGSEESRPAIKTPQQPLDSRHDSALRPVPAGSFVPGGQEPWLASVRARMQEETDRGGLPAAVARSQRPGASVRGQERGSASSWMIDRTACGEEMA